MLRPLQGIFTPTEYPQLLVGLAEPDDAAVYQLDEMRAIISTTDFFPPVVDDPYAFGAIAAANALSDVYAMGGRPIMAINLAAFPDGYDLSVLSDILRGGAEKVREAGAVIAGGHTVVDKEPKYGLCVTGEIHPQKLKRKSGAQPEDVLILTKKLGTGIVTTAHKRQLIADELLQDAIQGMMRLNRRPAELSHQYAVHAMTDITGFGLMGHGHEVAHLSQITLEIRYEALEWYQGAETFAEQEVFPGGLTRNQLFYSPWVQVVADLREWQTQLLYDPQTSGGLLMSVGADDGDALLDELHTSGEQAYVIGRVVAGKGGAIRII